MKSTCYMQGYLPEYLPHIHQKHGNLLAQKNIL